MFCIGSLALGAGAGFISAGLGLGGGVIMVPAFVVFARLDPHTAKGTSLFIIIFIAAVNAWRHSRGYEDKQWKIAAWLALGSVGGGYFGGWVTGFMSGKTVLWIFMALLGLLAVRTLMIRPRLMTEKGVRQRFLPASAIGLATGVGSGMTGTGGGAVLVPLVLLARLATNERVVGLSNMVMVVTSAAATLAHLRAEPVSDMPWTVGQVNFALAPLTFVGAQLGSPAGKWISDRLTLGRRRIIMGVILLLIAGSLLWRATG